MSLPTPTRASTVTSSAPVLCHCLATFRTLLQTAGFLVKATIEQASIPAPTSAMDVAIPVDYFALSIR